MDKKKITYKQVRDKKKYYISIKKTNQYLYKGLSFPFTYMFIKLGFSPNTITLLEYLLCVIGYIFLSIGTYKYLIIGLLFFILFYAFDSSDGDVARILNQKSIEGVFFDEISHYVFAICLGIGVGQGLSKIYQSETYFLLGTILAISMATGPAIRGYALLSTLRKGIMDNKISEPYSSISKKLDNIIYKGKSWADGNILVRMFGVYPFEGLFYSIYYIAPILIISTIIEIFLSNTFNILINITLIYLMVLAVVKTFWIVAFLYKMNKNRYITKVIMR